MRLSFRIVLTVGVAGVVLAAWILSGDSANMRVLARTERIHVVESSGKWFHEYTVLAGVANSGTVGDTRVDSLTLNTSQAQFDATRFGAHLLVKRLRGLSRVAWLSDTSSAWLTAKNYFLAHIKSYHQPVSVSPLEVQQSGLARVVAVHNIERHRPFWSRGPVPRPQWLYLVEVEFWAQRARNLVRTIDVIDAGSMPGLHSGDIVQMHFDQQQPRVVRLDDGMRTFQKR